MGKSENSGRISRHRNTKSQRGSLRLTETKVFIRHYIRHKYMAEFSAALKKDPVNKRIASAAKRLRDEEDYDEDESRKYAIKKRKFLIEKEMDDYDQPSYEENEEQTSALPYKTQRDSLFPIKQ